MAPMPEVLQAMPATMLKILRPRQVLQVQVATMGLGNAAEWFDIKHSLMRTYVSVL